MEIFDAIFLGVIQGITEFLPISSSGHLIIAENYMELPVAELKGFDIAVHAGTLAAIFAYFRKDFWAVICGIFGKKTKFANPFGIPPRKFLVFLILGTVPAVLTGLILGDFLDEHFRNSTSVAFTLIAVGIFFFIAEYINGKIANKKLDLNRSIGIGIAQAVALIPGVSRSGSTISIGLVLGLTREQAARFSFLLGSVAITAATAFSIYKSLKGEFALPEADILAAGVAASFLCGLLAVFFLMKFLKTHSLRVFGVYRILLGLIILLAL